MRLRPSFIAYVVVVAKSEKSRRQEKMFPISFSL